VNIQPKGIAILFCSLIVLQGCETLGPNLSEKRLIDEPSLINVEQNELSNKQAEGDIAPEQSVVTQQAKVYKGSGVFINSKAKKKTPLKANEKGSYTLNFTNVDISEVIQIILGDTLKYNFLISPQVKGKVSLTTSKALTEKELLPALQMLLGVNNAVLIEEAGLYRVQPKASALVAGGAPVVLNQTQSTKGFQIRVMPLQYIGVADMKKILEPILGKGSVLQVDPNRNLLFVSGNSAELKNSQELVDLFDVDIMQGQSVGLFPLRYIEADVIEKELAEIFGLSEKGPLVGMLRIIPVERMNSLMVISKQAKYLAQAQQWINRLDKAGSQGESGGVHVYHVQNVDAVELANILDQVYPEAETTQRKSKVASLAPGLKPIVISSNDKNRKIKPQTNRLQRNTTISSETQGTIRIIPDEMNNSLVIVAKAQDYESVKKVIKELDVTPLQVLVDATIVEVSLTDELHYGLQWFFSNKSGGYSGTGRIGDSNLNAAGVGGFAYSVVNSSNVVRAELNALASDSKVKVLSSPSLMVLNNQEATIKVGDQVPIRTSESANTSSTIGDTAIITSTIQMRDTGVTLTVKPRVNAGGLVIMEIEQNVDGVSRTESSEIDSPTIQQRQIKTSVAVHSGESIVLGGLITEQRERGKSGVPVLSRLPIIGVLFGKTDKVLDRTELVVLLTPRVVTNRVDSRAITHEFKRKLTDIYTSLRDEKSSQEK